MEVGEEDQRRKAAVQGIESAGTRELTHCGLEQPRIKTEVLGHSLVRLLALLTRSLAPDCLCRSRPLLRSLVCLLRPARFA